jgi:hypothetical protein
MESDERQIRIWRNDNEIFSGESYNPLERLRVSVRWVTEYDDASICFYHSQSLVKVSFISREIAP